MKIIVTLIIGVFSTALLAQSLSKDRANVETTCGMLSLVNYNKANSIDTLFCERLNYDQTQYDPYVQTIFVYDDLGRIVSSEYGYYSFDGYRLSSRSEYTYTLFDSIETYTGYYWNDTVSESGEWDAITFRSYSYNEDNRLASELWMYKPIYEDDWVSQRLNNYTYENEKLMEITYNFPITDYSWRPYMKSQYNYENGILNYRLDSYSSEEDDWRYTYKYKYEYYTDQLVLIEMNYAIDEWRNIRKHTFDLDENGNILADLEEHWNSHDSIWDTLLLDKKEYQYDYYGNKVSFLHRSAYIEWFNVAKEDYHFENGYLVGGIQYYWDWNEEEWYERVKCNIKSAPGILSTNQLSLANQVSLYPNPALEDFRVSVPNGVSLSSIMLYDVGGKTIKQFEFLPNIIDISELDKGIYFVTINLENEIVTKKIIKQ
jgi:hypothetical protein